MSSQDMIPLNFQSRSIPEMQKRSEEFLQLMRRRRSVREFSEKQVPREIIEHCVKTALTAPSGANQQPWHFVIINDPETKTTIRRAAEEEEHEFYEHRAPDEWLDVLEPLGTDERKPFLENAPYLIAIFGESYGLTEECEKYKNYYVKESVGIATGMLITALHNAGLATLTHTPSPMRFLNEILHRPENEKPFLLLVVGFPTENAHVPDISKKPFGEVVTFF